MSPEETGTGFCSRGKLRMTRRSGRSGAIDCTRPSFLQSTKSVDIRRGCSAFSAKSRPTPMPLRSRRPKAIIGRPWRWPRNSACALSSPTVTSVSASCAGRRGVPYHRHFDVPRDGYAVLSGPALSSARSRHRFGNALPGLVMPSCRNGIDPVTRSLRGRSGSRADGE
jgi:hypothetical protein